MPGLAVILIQCPTETFANDGGEHKIGKARAASLEVVTPREGYFVSVGSSVSACAAFNTI